MVRNPFPDYPVTRLQDRNAYTGPTIETPQILQARDLVEQYASYWAEVRVSQEKPKALIVSIRGDYGVGKTFLLVDSINELYRKLRDNPGQPKATVLRIACLETDPVTWYRTEIGPALEGVALSDVMAHVYAKAAEGVADEARLTEAAVERLQKEPRFVFSLVNQNLLNRTAVDERLFEILRKECDIRQEDVTKALAGLVWDQTASVSTQWLAGHELSASELDPLRIRAPLADEATAAASLTALASIHNFLRRPCSFIVDELEHLTRYDTSHNGRRNITWMKRLLEGLAGSAVLVLIAGHWEAWEAWGSKPDSPGRLSQQPQIELWRIEPGDVEKIVHGLVDRSTPLVFDASEAQTTVDLTNGNLRRVLSLLRIMFNATNGFANALSTEEIKSLAEQSGQKISLEDAKLRLHEILERRGMQVQAPAALSGIEFDLVGYEVGKPAILAEFKHTALQEQQGVSYFLSRVLSVQSQYPGVLGFFVVDGNIDRQVLDVLNNAPVPIVAFDLTQPEVTARFAAGIDKHFKGIESPDAGQTIESLRAMQQSLVQQIQVAQQAKDTELASALSAERAAIQRQLDKIAASYDQLTRSVEQQVSAAERERQEEARRFEIRIAGLISALQSEREKSIAVGSAPRPPNDDSSKLNSLYSELTSPPSVLARVTAAVTLPTLLVFILAVVSLVLWGVIPLYKYFDSLILALGCQIVAIVGFSFVVIFFVLRSKDQNQYREFSTRMLREVYVRSRSDELLATADQILRTSLDEAGPIEGRKVARKALAEAFPDIFGYLQYLDMNLPRQGQGQNPL